MKFNDDNINKLQLHFKNIFKKFANDKKNKKGIRSQKHVELINYNDNIYTITFDRGDKLNSDK